MALFVVTFSLFVVLGGRGQDRPIESETTARVSYTAAQQKETVQDLEGKAYLRLAPAVTRVEGDSYDDWLYSFAMYEENGPFHTAGQTGGYGLERRQEQPPTAGLMV